MLTTTPTTTPVLRHADDCTGPLEYLTTGRFGDTLVRCRNCHGWALAKAEPVPPPEHVQNARRPPRARSGAATGTDGPPIVGSAATHRGPTPPALIRPPLGDHARIASSLRPPGEHRPGPQAQ